MRRIFIFAFTCFVLFQILIIYFYCNELFKILQHFDTKSRQNLSLYLIRNNSSLSKESKTNRELRVTDGQCVGILYPSQIEAESSWNPVDINGTSYVFSAYLTDMGKNIVIIGASMLKPAKCYCQFWLKNDSSIRFHIQYTKPAKIKHIPEGHNRKFTASLFECKGVPFIPTHVSLVTKLCDIPLNLMQVRNASVPSKYQRLFTVCLPPLRMADSRTNDLVEWIELNRILGAEKIIVYNYSITYEISKVLEYYSSQGLVEIVTWQLPNQKMANSSSLKHFTSFDTFYFAQLAAVEDCLFRNKHESKFIVHNDVDEYVIPHKTDAFTWSDMLKPLDNKTSSYNIRHAWFRKEWNGVSVDFKNRDLAQKFGLVTLLKNQRMAYIHTHWVRSKYIARTSAVTTLMIHRIARGPPFVVVPPEVGLLHHYRFGENETALTYRKRKMQWKVKDDTVIQKYARTLIQNVQIACKTIQCRTLPNST